MALLAWLTVAVAFAGLLGRARPRLQPLPAPVDASWMPAYVLVWSGDAAPPDFEPAPAAVAADLAAARRTGLGHALVLAPGLSTSPALPRHLFASGADFASAFPECVGPMTVEEAWLRDFAGAAAVEDLAAPAGFADPRCAWLRLGSLDLPGEGTEPVLRAARARKAHGLPVALRAGRDVSGATLVGGPPTPSAAFDAALGDRLLGDPVLRAFVGWFPVGLHLTAGVCLAFPTAWRAAVLFFGVNLIARLWRAATERTGLRPALAGLWEEPLLALRIVRSRPDEASAPFPVVPTGPTPRLTGPQTALHGLDARLDASAVLHLARRLGGASTVMEQIYGNRPSGQTRFGRVIDRWVQASAGARALRHRCLSVAELARGLAPRALLSVPGGSGRDAAAIGAPATVLVDPDPAARALATAVCPGAEILNGTVESSPPGPFDVAIYVGLAEYLEDAEVVRHLVHMRARLGPGGALITSTTAPHPDQQFMAERLGWRTRARRPEAFVGLLDAAGFRVETRLVDPLGVQWVLLARPIGQRGTGPTPAVSGA